MRFGLVARNSVAMPAVAVMTQHEIFAGANPHSPNLIHQQTMRILEQFFHRISHQRDKLVVYKLKNARALHANPHPSLPVFEQRRDALAFECFCRIQRQQLSVLPQHQSGIRANPKSSGGIFCQRRDGISRQSIPHRERGDLIVLPTAQTAVGAANPECVATIFEQRAYQAAFDSFLTPKSDKAQAIEARQPVIASNPEVTIMGLHQGTDGALWQALLLLPGLKIECPRTASGTGGCLTYPGTAHIHKSAEGSRNGQVAECPSATATGMTQADFVKTRIGIEARRQASRLIGFVCARTQVGI